MAGSLANAFFHQTGKSVDKWEQYLGVYERELARFIKKGHPIALLEIGVQNGGSLELWKNYLPLGSTITGLDIDPKISDLVFNDKHVETYIVDVTDTPAVENALGDRTFDVIIDDGSHRSTDVIATFQALFDRVRSGGLFVVEDLHCSYFPTHEGGFRRPGTSIEWLKRLVDAVNYDHIDRGSVDAPESLWLSDMNRRIAGISFYDSIAVIEKFKIGKKQPFRRLLSGTNDTVVRNASWIHPHPREAVKSMLLGSAAARTISEDLLLLVETTRSENALLRKRIVEATAQVEATAHKDAAEREAAARFSEAERKRHQAEVQCLTEQHRDEETRLRTKADVSAILLREREARLRSADHRLLDVTAASDRALADLALAHAQLTTRSQEIRAASDLLDGVGIAPAGSLPGRVKALVTRQSNMNAKLGDVWHLAQREDIRLSALTANHEILERRLTRALEIIEELRSRVLDGSRSRAQRSARWLRRLVGRGLGDPAADLSRVDSATAAIARLDTMDLHELAAHGALDIAYYLRNNPDLVEAEIDPVSHYFAEGADEGRRPHARFDAEWYIAQNLDVAEAGLNPLVHYASHGASENRPTMPGITAEQHAIAVVLGISGLFDDTYYRARYPDTVAGGDDPLNHFISIGADIGYDPSATFNTAAYRQDHPDVAAAGTNPLLHYALHGWREGRVVRAPVKPSRESESVRYETTEAKLIRASGLFDPDWYASHYVDVPSHAEGAWQHFVDHGRVEGRHPNAGFDPVWYATMYPDIGDISEALLHYIRHGAVEGRRSSKSFDAAWYAATYPDVAGISGALAHFVGRGQAEGRLPQGLGSAGVVAHAADAMSLFDARWYSGHYPDVPQKAPAAWDHFIHHGWTEKRQPNAYFDPAWYERTYSDVADAGLDPLQHFLQHGAEEGRAPSADFDTAWYRVQDTNLLASGENPLAHYLREGRAQGRPTLNPNGIYRNAVIDEAQNFSMEHNELVRHVALMLLRPQFIIMIEGDDDVAKRVTLRSLDHQLYPAHKVISEADLLTSHKRSSTGLDFIVWLQAGDTLNARALYEYASHINAEPDIDLLYADEDVLGPTGRCQPFYKPAWSPDTLETFNYVGCGACFRMTVADVILPNWNGFYDFVLRFTEISENVCHIRQILCHRSRPADLTTSEQTRQDIVALEGRLSRTGRMGRVTPILSGFSCLDVQVALRDEPLVSIVIPTAGKTVEIGDRQVDLLVNCLDQVRDRSSYKNIEIIVVDNGDLTDRQLRNVSDRGAIRVTYEDPIFNISKKLNMGAAAARGELLLLLNDDTEPLNADWIERLVEHFEKPHVGVVGAKLLYKDLLTQHVGVVTNQGRPDHVGRLRPRHEPGYFFSSCGTRNYLAVTGACMMTPAKLFESVGGYSEALAISYNDVDYCLKLRNRSRTSVYAPRAELIHFESKSRVASLDASEELYFFRRWAEATIFDPYYNEQGLSVAPPTFELRNNARVIG